MRRKERAPFNGRKDDNFMKKEKNTKIWNCIFMVILVLFPLRHVNYGIDWRDVGYNYLNYLNFGTSHMDSMWMFSTYAATFAGHLMTMLPFGHTLTGLNVYTGLVLSLTAAISYRYVVKRFEIGIIPAFLGELIAECFCWCPTALLYNYLSYFFMVLCVICLEKGLLEKRNFFLVFSGALLGMNVFVRFSNLPEVILIIGVWAVGFLEYRADVSKEGSRGQAVRQTLFRTLYCMSGYLGIVILMLGIMALKYGADAYFQGIMRLLSMPAEASDYTVFSMLYSIYITYIRELYWIVRISFFAVCGLAGAWIGSFAVRKLAGSPRKLWMERMVEIFFSCAAAAGMLVWLYGNDGDGNFASSIFTSYDSMIRPATLFLMFAEVFFLTMVFLPRITLEIKTICGFVLLTLAASSVGSNNGVMSGFNNLFLAAPLILGLLYGFFQKKWEQKERTLPVMPFAAICGVFFLICLIQGLGFAKGFIFAEGTGISGELVKNNSVEVLSGVRLQPDRNKSLTEISEVIEAARLQNAEVLVYGNIPSAAFYLGLTPVFNPWPDLKSYSLDAFGEAMGKMWEDMDEDASYRRMILISKEITNPKVMENESAGFKAKAEKIFETVDKYDYKPLFEDEKFLLFGISF